MSTYTGTVSSVCPFYLRESKNSVTCEGLEKGQVLSIRFEHAEDKPIWQDNNCFKINYMKYCPLARILAKKYEGEI